MLSKHRRDLKYSISRYRKRKILKNLSKEWQEDAFDPADVPIPPGILLPHVDQDNQITMQEQDVWNDNCINDLFNFISTGKQEKNAEDSIQEQNIFGLNIDNRFFFGTNAATSQSPKLR